MPKTLVALTLVALFATAPLSASAGEDAPKRLVTFQFENEDVRTVITTICAYAEANVILHPDVKGKVTLSLREVPWDAALEAIVAAVGGAVVEEAVVVQIHDVRDLLGPVPDLLQQVRALPAGVDARVQGKTALVIRATETDQDAVATFLARVRRDQALRIEIEQLRSELRTLRDEVKRLSVELEALREQR